MDTGQSFGYTVVIVAGTNNDESRTITGNTADTITWTTPLPSAIEVGKAYNVYDGSSDTRHYMRMTNSLNELCVECHYYRNQTHAYVEGPGDGTKVFSHPFGQALNANGKDYDRSVPLDADGNAQTGPPRYAGSPADGDNTNNLVLGSDSTVRCLSCHYIHKIN
jgi:hypothetical protein